MNSTILEIKSPYTDKVISKLSYNSEFEVFNKLDTAYNLMSKPSAGFSPLRRLDILRKFKDLLSDNKSELSHTAASEGGKPLNDTYVEIDRAINGVEVAISEIMTMKGSEIPMGITNSSLDKIAYTKHYPIGVVLAISAFNHPVNLIIHQVIPAIAMGCPVIIKPARKTPLSCAAIVDLLQKAGLDADWCQMIICDRDITEKLVADSRVSYLSFVGSSRVGWSLRSKLAPGAKCALEHGGAAPIIVDKSANLNQVASSVAKAAFYHAGQVCVSAQRVYVHNQIMDDFTAKLRNITSTLRVGDPLNEQTEVGPIISKAELNRIDSWVKEATTNGAELVCGGKIIGNNCYEPTILLEPSTEDNVSKKEIFGPVVCLYPFDKIDDAIEMANNSDYAFQSAIFTNNLDVSMRAIDLLDAKTVLVNDHTAFRVDWMPFGGYKKSGLGVGGIGPAMRDMSTERMFVINKKSPL